MQLIPGGAFAMGSDRFYPEERPARTVWVDAFLMDEVPVTNREFARFVAATGHRSWAEIPPSADDYPGMSADMAVAGSAVFRRPDRFVDLRDPLGWWRFLPGADWRRPSGSGSSLEGMEDHPVVHVAYSDAEAYARWAGKQLPTEAEWERAARGGLDDADYAWGDELAPGGVMMANYWQGRFPYSNTLDDGWEGTSPVRSYTANAFGIFDLIGNVWEWTADWYAPHRSVRGGASSCCVPANPKGPRREDSIDAASGGQVPRKVLKGGSHLCASNYCQRYRPSARHPEPVDTTTSHVGFRCIRRLPASRTAAAAASSPRHRSSSK